MMTDMFIGFKAVGASVFNFLKYAALALVVLKVIEITWYLLAPQNYREFLMKSYAKGGRQS